MESAGFRLEAHGGVLRVAPADKLTTAQRAWLAANKAALVAVLAEPHNRWLVEYSGGGGRLLAVYSPARDRRTVSADYPGAAIWPAPDDLDVVAWIGAKA